MVNQKKNVKNTGMEKAVSKNAAVKLSDSWTQ